MTLTNPKRKRKAFLLLFTISGFCCCGGEGNGSSGVNFKYYHKTFEKFLINLNLLSLR